MEFRSRTKRARLLVRVMRDERGGVSAEYMVVTALGLFVAASLAVIGVAMVDSYGASLEKLYTDAP
jgi:Flp pilus assembly pilin Flp